jgi:hypothetical protein
MAKRKLPKWRLKANWLLRELARIWYGKAEAYPLFEGENFIEAFTDVLIQAFVDLYDAEDEAWYGAEYAIEALSDNGVQPIFYLTQASKAREVLIQAIIRLHRKPFLYEKAMRRILWLAHEIEMRLKAGQKPPYKPLKRLRDLSYYESLPVLPID